MIIILILTYYRQGNLYSVDSPTNTYYMSFCGTLSKKTCSSESTMMTRYLRDSASEQCDVLSGGNPTANSHIEMVAKTETVEEHLVIHYNGGGKCETDPLKPYAPSLEIKCDRNETFKFNTIDEITDPCRPYIVVSSKYGCKKASLNAIWAWIESNKWVMFGLCLLIGGFVCFFGRKLFRPMLFLVGLLLTVALIMLLFYSTFLKENTKNWVGWVVLGGAVLLGLVVGFLFTKLIRLGAFALAGWGGFSIALLIWNAFLYHIDS